MILNMILSLILIYYLTIELTQREMARNDNHQDPIHHEILQVRANNQIEVVSLNGYICCGT